MQPLRLRVTYHDPCYLARYNGVTEAPRRILSALGLRAGRDAAQPGQHVLLRRGRRADLDGRLRASPSAPARTGSRRRRRLDVKHFVVSCPKDMTMYSDAAKTTGHADRLAVLDITQLVATAVAPPENELQEAGVPV